MGWPQFLAWAATQGFKNIKVLRQAYNSFKKFPGKDVVLKTAKNLWDDVLKKTSTKDLAAKVRQGYKKRPFPGFKPKIVPKKSHPLADALNAGKYKTVSTPSRLKPPSIKKSNVIPFPKKPPTLKAGGGRIDKALSGRSRDI